MLPVRKTWAGRCAQAHEPGPLKASKHLGALSASIILICSCAHHSPLDSPDVTVDSTPVQLEVYGHMPYVHLRIDGKGPFVFAVDTGSSVTCVDEALADELRLERHRSPAGPTDGSGSTVESPFTVTLGQLALGSTTFGPAEAFVVRIPRATAPRLHGILGMNLFRNTVLTLDFTNDKLELEQGTLPVPDGKTCFGLYQDSGLGLAGVDLQIDGVTRGFIIDSGAPDMLMMDEYTAQHSKFATAFQMVGSSLSMADVRMDDKVARLEGDATLGNYVLRNPIVSLASKNFVGAQFLAHFVVRLDLAHMRMELKQPIPSPIESAPVRTLGVSWDRGEDGVPIVVATHAEFPAAAVLKKGDRILAANSAAGSTDACWLQIVDPTGTNVHLRVQREGQVIDIDLPVTSVPN